MGGGRSRFSTSSRQFRQARLMLTNAGQVYGRWSSGAGQLPTASSASCVQQATHLPAGTMRRTDTGPSGGSMARGFLLIDDTWTAGGHAQSAYALREAGAANIALLVIGRHLRREWEITEGVTSGDLFDELPTPFDWTRCAAR